MAIVSSPIITQRLSVATSSPGTQVGTEVLTTDGGHAVFLIALSAIAIYDAVAILNSSSATGATMCAAPITTTNAAQAARMGIAQNAIAVGEYGWIRTAGYDLRVNVAIATQPAVPLFTTATGGVLSGTIVSGGFAVGVIAKTSAASASAVQCVMANGVIAHSLG